MNAAPQNRRGFTLIEMISVITIISILAVSVIPNFGAISPSDFKAAMFRESVLAALRFAEKAAVSHRRLVCLTTTTATITLTVAATNPASVCSSATLNLNGESGVFLTSPAPAQILITNSPGGVIYFQPSGSATSDGAGAVPADFTITVSGTTPVLVSGSTGSVN